MGRTDGARMEWRSGRRTRSDQEESASEMTETTIRTLLVGGPDIRNRSHEKA